MTDIIPKLDPKTDGSSMDVVQTLVDQLRSIVPEAFTEGKIDFDILRELLGDEIDQSPERYSFNWHGKSRARRIAQTPSTGTLRPCPEQSVNWENSRNIFIEGDNLEVLKLLQKSYHKRVKMIYIDPPYNTGNEFIYPDKFQDNLDTYLRYTGQIDDEGLRVSANSEAGGRYHTNWLNMMYPRLKLARNLLRDDGIIFVSIDDNEVSRLRLVCDEIFGEENFVSVMIWQKVFSPKNTAKYFSEDHDYILAYARSKEVWRPQLLPRSDEAISRYTNPDNDPRGPWSSSDLTARNFYGDGQYEVTGPTGKVFKPGKGSYWRRSLSNFRELDADNRIWWGESGDNMPRLKRFISDVKDGVVPQTLLLHTQVGNTQEAKKELLEFSEFEETENVLNSVKPVRLLKHLLQVATDSSKDDEQIVLDFFAGSGVTGHAVAKQNEEDGGHRRFILVQLPEPLPKEDKKANTIADLAKSRLRNVMKSIEGPNGFRTFRLSSSNVVPWNGDPESTSEALLNATSHLYPDRTANDLVVELLLKSGIDLCTPIETRQILGGELFIVGAGAAVICLCDDITLDLIEHIADLKEELSPEVMRVFFKDSGFPDDVTKTNAVQILRQRGIEDVKSL